MDDSWLHPLAFHKLERLSIYLFDLFWITAAGFGFDVPLWKTSTLL